MGDDIVYGAAVHDSDWMVDEHRLGESIESDIMYGAAVDGLDWTRVDSEVPEAPLQDFRIV